MQKITPFLWFDGQAEEAMSFYVSVFANSRILSVTPGPNGKAMSVTCQLDGQQLYALNGGPMYTFTPAISFFVSCETQEEVDELWGKLVDGGKEQQCGWLTDRFGLSWQIIPSTLGKMLGDGDPARAGRVMTAMLQMVKMDMKRLQQAYDAE